MKVYTYSSARQNFAAVLNKVKDNGVVFIKRKDGSMFELKPVKSDGSPLDVEGIDIGTNKDEIIDIVKEARAGYTSGKSPNS